MPDATFIETTEKYERIKRTLLVLSVTSVIVALGAGTHVGVVMTGHSVTLHASALAVMLMASVMYYLWGFMHQLSRVEKLNGATSQQYSGDFEGALIGERAKMLKQFEGIISRSRMTEAFQQFVAALDYHHTARTGAHRAFESWSQKFVGRSLPALSSEDFSRFRREIEAALAEESGNRREKYKKWRGTRRAAFRKLVHEVRMVRKRSETALQNSLNYERDLVNLASAHTRAELRFHLLWERLPPLSLAIVALFATGYVAIVSLWAPGLMPRSLMGVPSIAELSAAALSPAEPSAPAPPAPPSASPPPDAALTRTPPDAGPAAHTPLPSPPM